MLKDNHEKIDVELKRHYAVAMVLLLLPARII